MEWSFIPRIMNGGKVFIVGGGPSAKNFDWNLLSGKFVIGCNASAFLLPQGLVKWAVFGDKMFLRNFRPQLRSFVDGGGILVNAVGRSLDETNHWMLNVKRLNGRKSWGLSDDRYILRWNRSTGACAIDLARLLGASEVVLIGFDMCSDGKSHNWHDAYSPYYVKRTNDNGNTWMPKPDEQLYSSRMIGAFNDIQRDAEETGMKIWNTNPDSRIKVFPFKPISELL